MKKNDKNVEKLNNQRKSIQGNLNISKDFINEEQRELDALKNNYDFSQDGRISMLLEEEERQLGLAREKLNEIESEIKKTLLKREKGKEKVVEKEK